MSRRLLAVILCGYIAGVAVSAIVGNGIYFILASVLLSVILRAAAKNNCGFRAGVIIILAFVIGSTWFAVCRTERDRYESQYGNKHLKVYGLVDETPYVKNGRYVITISQKDILYDTNTYKENGRITVYVNDTFFARLGDRLIVSGLLMKPSSANNSNGFDYNLYMRSKDIRGTMFVTATDIYKLGNTSSFKNKIRDFGGVMKNKMDTFVHGDAGNLLKGIALGDTSGFSEELKSSFASSGISHIVAVSGMNVSILIAFIMFITGKVGGKRKLRAILSISGVIIYMILTGCSPSVMRAGVMGILMLSAILLDKKEDFFTSFILSAALILIINPYSIYNASFLLSFSATAGILVFGKPFSRICAKIMPNFFADIVGISAAAIIATAPIMAVLFNSFSVIAIVTNILVVPYVEILFIGSFITILVGSIFAPLGMAFGWILQYLTNIILYVSNTLSALPFATVVIATPDGINLLSYGVMLIMLYKFLYKKKISKLFITLTIVCITASVLFSVFFNNDFRVEFINVGQGDCILVSAPYNKNYLIDTGKKNNKDTLQYLKSRGITKLETIFLSHSDDDHSSGLADLIKNIKVTKVVLPYIKFYSPTLIDCQNIAVTNGVDVEYADRFSTYSLGGGIVDIVWPEDNDIEKNQDNNNSLVMRLDYKGNSFLFTGDIEEDGEEFLMDTDENIDVDILKVSHHGSKYATSSELIEKVTPSYAVISVGKNQYGHPTPEVISRLEAADCNIYRTDKNGNVVFTINTYGHMRIASNK